MSVSKVQKIEKTEEFIAKWQEKECLWKVDSAQYRDRDERRKAVSELAALFEMTGTLFLILPP